jgi:T5SS/PEP-CTERM-associated repeat protein
MHRMRHGCLIVGLLVGIVLGPRRSEAQYTTDYQTNIITGTTNNWAGNYLVGSNTFADVLLIQDSGVLSNGYGYLGYEVSSSNNSVLVTGTGSVWSNFSDLSVGQSGSGNSLVISNGGQVVNSNSYISSYIPAAGYVGYNSSSSNNNVLVAGPGSVWNDNGELYVGYSGASNSLVISNGGQVASWEGYVGYTNNANENSVLVIGPGSVWHNGIDLSVGFHGTGNNLVISNGGQVVNGGTGYVGRYSGSSNNSALVTGTGSVWSNWYNLSVGNSGASNSLVIRNGGYVFNDSDAWVGGANNSVLVTGPGSVWKSGESLSFGGSGDSLVISNGGEVLVFALDSYVGGYETSSNNSVLVTGTGSVWNTRLYLSVGGSGAGNNLVISDGGQVVNAWADVGFDSSSSNNGVLVTGPGSAWNNGGDLSVGGSGAGNSLVISNGGQVVSGGTGYVGYYSGSSNNSVLVTGTGSVWSSSSSLFIGSSGPGNRLVISNGGRFVNSSGYVGSFSSSSNNSARVADGAIWQNNILYIGYQASSNSLAVAGGSVFATNLTIGFASATCDNLVQLDSGSVIVTNAIADAVLEVRQGTFILNAGVLQVDRFVMTNACAQFVHTGGTLSSGGTSVTNAQTFGVGNGSSAATFHLSGGVHSFANNLQIRTNASLTGCGTITGNVVVDPGGTVLADCGGTLSFTGTVTNNGSVLAVNGTCINFFGPVVNNGVINTTNGSVRFWSSIQNNGTILLDANGDADGDGMLNGWEQAYNLDPLNAADANVDSDGDGFTNLQEFQAGTDPTNSASALRITSLVSTGNDVLVTWTMGSGRTNALQVATGDASGGYTNNFADLFTITNTVGTVTNYLDVGAATNFPARYYRIRLIP